MDHTESSSTTGATTGDPTSGAPATEEPTTGVPATGIPASKEAVDSDSGSDSGSVADSASATQPVAASGHAEADVADVSVSDGDEVKQIDELESDLAAVEQAIVTLDEIAARGVGGELAANEISAAVSEARFGN